MMSAKSALDQDPDILAENTGRLQDLTLQQQAPAILDDVPLHVVNGTHIATPATAALLESVGGHDAILRFTTIFYQKCFKDPHIDQFIRSHDDPHGQRMANWICEKMGGEAKWTAERRTRSRCPVHVAGGTMVVHDRSSAHFAAWHSLKREPHKQGEHFKLDDCRVWMRLNFWSAREAGLMDHPQFASWYPRFIAHFVRVYERTAPPFARESARWSQDEANTSAYLNNGRTMPDVMGVSLQTALRTLPSHEQQHSNY